MNTKTIIVAAVGFLAACGLAFAEWTEPVPILEVNTEYDERLPFISFDGLSLYFVRSNTDTFYYKRIYQATRPEPYGPFTSVEEISTLNYPDGDVSAPWISPDNLRMYYYRRESGIQRLKVTERASIYDPWLPGTNISELNALGVVCYPSLTEDELTIFFVGYNLPGNLGEYDIWMATRPDMSSPFENIRNLTEINSTAVDGGPTSNDGLTLHFHSNRNGTGQIFKATRSSLSEPFGNLEHLSFFDVPDGISGFPCISSDGTAFYFNRALGTEPKDIYVSYLIEEDPLEAAINRIEDAIAEKLDVLDHVNATIDKEWAAYEALEELLESGDYGDLKQSDITKAMQKILLAIKGEELSKNTIEKSIENLEDALSSLGHELELPVQ